MFSRTFGKTEQQEVHVEIIVESQTPNFRICPESSVCSDNFAFKSQVDGFLGGCFKLTMRQFLNLPLGRRIRLHEIVISFDAHNYGLICSTCTIWTLRLSRKCADADRVNVARSRIVTVQYTMKKCAETLGI